MVSARSAYVALTRNAASGNHPKCQRQLADEPNVQRLRDVMPWNGSAAMPFTLSLVHLYAPKMSGVYALFAENAWFYVGESDNISASLMGHLRGKKTWEAELDPRYFAFELLTGVARGARKDKLSLQYSPAYSWRETSWIRLQQPVVQPQEKGHAK